uniref:C2H2-type domain-containing protein n=2 Tax=Hemiselmis andersenii TaxID=464988 RepID=A0A6U2ABR3_HEMAN
MGVGMKTKKKGTNTKTSFAKQKARERFLNRHIDQVWKDVRADAESEPARGVRDDSALPRTTKQPLDEDLPAMGQFYCPETGKYFINLRALQDHKKSRFYKMRVKQLKGERPHNQKDAEAAVGLGVDHGKKLGRDPRKQGGETMSVD